MSTSRRSQRSSRTGSRAWTGQPPLLQDRHHAGPLHAQPRALRRGTARPVQGSPEHDPFLPGKSFDPGAHQFRDAALQPNNAVRPEFDRFTLEATSRHHPGPASRAPTLLPGRYPAREHNTLGGIKTTCGVV